MYINELARHLEKSCNIKQIKKTSPAKLQKKIDQNWVTFFVEITKKQPMYKGNFINPGVDLGFSPERVADFQKKKVNFF